MEEALLKALIGKTRPRKNYVEANAVDEQGNYYMDEKARKAQAAGDKRKIEIVPKEKLKPVPEQAPLDVSGFQRSDSSPSPVSSPKPAKSIADMAALKIPNMPSEQPAPSVAAPELKERYPAMQSESTNWDWGNIAVALAPVIAGYASGAPDIGFTKGGQGLAQRYKEELDLNNARIKALQKKSAAGTNLKPVKMEDGTIRYLSEEEAMGKEVGYAGSDLKNYQARKDIQKESSVETARAKGQLTNFREDEDGRLIAIDKPTGQITPVGDVSGLSPEARKDAKDYVKQYNKSVEKDLDSYADLESSFKSLLDNNQLGNKTAVMGIVKDIETRLSDYDRAYYTGEISEAAQIRARARQFKSNEMNPRLLKDAMGLIGRFLAKKKKRVADKRKKFKSQLKGAREELTPEQLDQVFGIRPDMSQGTFMKKGNEILEVPWDNVQEALEEGYKVIREDKMR